MRAEELVKSIYLGDRGVKALFIDIWDETVRIKIQKISRVRDPSGNWNFYTAEDIDDGIILLEGVRSLSLTPPGFLPNDYIHGYEVRRLPGDDPDIFEFEMEIGSVDERAKTTAVTLRIVAKAMSLEDPSRPGLKIDYAT